MSQKLALRQAVSILTLLFSFCGLGCSARRRILVASPSPLTSRLISDEDGMIALVAKMNSHGVCEQNESGYFFLGKDDMVGFSTESCLGAFVKWNHQDSDIPHLDSGN